MSTDVKLGGGGGGGGGRHDLQLVKDFLQGGEPTVLQGCAEAVLQRRKGRKCVLSRFDLLLL